MKISLESAREIEDAEGWEFIEESDWEDGGKYQFQDVIIKKDGQHYMFTISRCGSYFSDYEYNYAEDKDGMIQLTPVTKKTKTIEYWG
jgi:hypothetical protein